MEFSIILLITSLLAGVLTVFAPCIFTFLPIVLGASNSNGNSIKKALTIIISLALSVFIFSLVLKASTFLIQIPQTTWDFIAGIIIASQGVIILLPLIWEKLSYKIGLSQSSKLLSNATKVRGRFGDILIGLSLGPIFSSCSPTYGFIIGALLQSGFGYSILYLTFYVIGLSLMLLGIAILGQNLVQKLKWGINPNGIFKKTIGILFVLLGILILTGFYKEVEVFIIENLPFLDITRIDRALLDMNIN